MSNSGELEKRILSNEEIGELQFKLGMILAHGVEGLERAKDPIYRAVSRIRSARNSECSCPNCQFARAEASNLAQVLGTLMVEAITEGKSGKIDQVSAALKLDVLWRPNPKGMKCRGTWASDALAPSRRGRPTVLEQALFWLLLEFVHEKRRFPSQGELRDHLENELFQLKDSNEFDHLSVNDIEWIRCFKGIDPGHFCRVLKKYEIVLPRKKPDK